MTAELNRLELRDVSKAFVMHLRGGATLPVVCGVSFEVRPGECVALGGPSGIGKSSILKMIFGNYRADQGQILLRDGQHVVDIAQAQPRAVLELRRRQVGYVSQFLRVIPRVSVRDIVAAAARETGLVESDAGKRAEALMTQLNIPERLWNLPPATFSGGEQQRVNIARGFAAERPLLLLDEPTAALDRVNRAVVVALIEAAKARGVSMLGIFHDDGVRAAVADRTVDVQQFAAGVAA